MNINIRLLWAIIICMMLLLITLICTSCKKSNPIVNKGITIQTRLLIVNDLNGDSTKTNIQIIKF